MPGDTLTYRVAIDDINKDGAIVSGTSHVGSGCRPRCNVLRPLKRGSGRRSLFDPAGLLAMLKLLGVFEIGGTPGSNRCKSPNIPSMPWPGMPEPAARLAI